MATSSRSRARPARRKHAASSASATTPRRPSSTFTPLVRSSLSRFVTPDWFDPVDETSAVKGNAAGWLANAVGTNRYAYAGNDPLNKSDPNGHVPVSVTAGVGLNGAVNPAPSTGVGTPADTPAKPGNERHHKFSAMTSSRQTKIEEIRSILISLWDPLAIGENPKLRDEYDSFIGSILKLQQEGDRAKLRRHLMRMEIELSSRGSMRRARRS
jgi:hypothetical protein